ncbi:MAG: hypothetical protein LBU64_12275 [Planctomycetota bacterium]|jgi:hypothetical protein|nr:hypothetical protein [Planctomycetota bacterium]
MRNSAPALKRPASGLSGGPSGPGFRSGRIPLRLGCLLALLLAAAGAGGRAGEIPNRLAKARIGEWALFQDVSAGEHSGDLTRFSVVDIRDGGEARTLVVRMEKLGPEGTAEESRDLEMILDEADRRTEELAARAKQVVSGQLLVGEREFPVVEVAWDDEDDSREIKIWLSEELPIGGLAKTWSSDPEFPAFELIDYGFPQ